MLEMLRSEFMAWSLCFGTFWFLLGIFCGLFIATRERRRQPHMGTFIAYNRREKLMR